jgi:hypothetical protein
MSSMHDETLQHTGGPGGTALPRPRGVASRGDDGGGQHPQPKGRATERSSQHAQALVPRLFAMATLFCLRVFTGLAIAKRPLPVACRCKSHGLSILLPRPVGLGR